MRARPNRPRFVIRAKERPMRRLLPLLCAVFLTGCATVPNEPLPTVPNVDLSRFMGDWYVIAHIPTFIEKNAYNAIERYDLAADGTIATTFTFREGGFDGEPKKYTPTGFVRDTVNNSTWGMQFMWPIKAEFLISYLDADYTRTVIARNSRDYVWIMARTPTIPDADYERLVAQLAAWGYDTDRLRRVPQRW
jgi:apolipoprotein D and lipocalin family protein